MLRLFGAPLFVVLFATATLARADDKPKSADVAKPSASGTWKWEVTFNGQSRETTLKLKQEGDKLTGTVSGQNGQETAIEDAKIDNGTVTFSVTRERNGQKFTRKYSGKLSGDTIKGTAEFERNGQTQSRDWEAKKQSAAELTGTWKWEMSNNGQTRETTLKLKQEGDKLTGTVSGRNGQETAIEDAKVENGTVTFSVVRERNGQKMTRKFSGKLNGDTIKGTSESERDGQTQSRDWEAKKLAVTGPTGTWKWTVNFGGQDHEMALTLKSEGDKLTGTVARDGQETAIEDATCKDGELSFTVVRELNGQKMTFKYTGKVKEDSMQGKTEIERDGQTRSFDWNAKKG